MIYYVEDDEEILNLILYTLKTSGFEAKGFNNADLFYDALKEKTPDLIMLDLMLPKVDGLTILRKLKSKDEYKEIPVIISTAKGSEYDKVIGLDTGADDYLVKPFGMMEMVSRIKALLRRSNKTKNEIEILSNGNITLDIGKHVAIVDGSVISLTLKEYDLLNLFLANLDHVFTRDTLLERVWGVDGIYESRTVDVHLGTLRTKLGKSGNLIETVRGVGYKMVKDNEKENI